MPFKQPLYGRLLALFPEEHQGRGVDRGAPDAVDDQPMTYGLVLSAESLRYRSTPSAKGERRVRKAARWLAANSRLAGDGKPGWGLPQDWDHRPAHTPFTITTAIALEGFLDALPLGIWSPAESDGMLKLMREVCARWMRELWVEGYSGGYFAYSPYDKSPPWFCINAPAMFLGAMARLLSEHETALLPGERKRLRSHCDALARAIAATARLRNGAPFWDYIAQPNPLNSKRPNDLIHQAYIIWGVENYRDMKGSIPLPWTRASALDSLDRFRHGDSIRFLAQDEPDLPAGRFEEPSNLWGAGMMLACYARWGTRDQAQRCFQSILKYYGRFPRLRVLPRDVSDDATFYPRDAAHVLFGLAYAAFAQVATARQPCRKRTADCRIMNRRISK